ncbi:hypothetical protein ACFYT4_17170 [Streptomyces sp. NPDC004609]|uniref:hypothetical protein n=1 Tax=Streptomyces sp. NPDC004609 TaxID=3364704 RepID=UPI0036BC7E29
MTSIPVCERLQGVAGRIPPLVGVSCSHTSATGSEVVHGPQQGLELQRGQAEAVRLVGHVAGKLPRYTRSATCRDTTTRRPK